MINLAKRLTENQKNQILDAFKNGFDLDTLSVKFDFTKFTISRNLKKALGETEFKKLVKKNKTLQNIEHLKVDKTLESKLLKDKENISQRQEKLESKTSEQIFSNEISFMEIAPMDYEIDNSVQKDLSSIPLDSYDLPNIVYMVIDKKIELQTKSLRDYPDWQFLSEEELNRKTIEIYHDLRIAKKNCSKDEKVIKVQNTKVFKIVAPILLSKGISRIVSDKNLIAI